MNKTLTLGATILWILSTNAMEQSFETKEQPIFPENWQDTIRNIVSSKDDPEEVIQKINSLALQDKNWNNVFADKVTSGSMVEIISSYSQQPIDMVAIAFDHPGTQAYLKKYIEQKPAARKRLEKLLAEVGRWESPDPVQFAKKLLQIGITPDAKDRGNILDNNPGSSALVTAASHGKKELVSLLLDHNANIEAKDPWDGRTPLMAAALYGYNETVQLLLARGANVDAQNSLKNTALIWAAYHACDETVKILLDAGADITIKNNDGKTALSEAKEAIFSQHTEKYEKIVKLLEERGAQE